MGCVSSKVAQKPIEQSNGHDTREGGGDEGRAPEEARPALPALANVKTKPLAATKRKGPSRVEPAAGQAKQAKVGQQSWGGGEEKEGETITDESGLQMRTPRASVDPCLHYAAKNGDLSMVHMLLGNSGSDSVVATASAENRQTDESAPTPGKVDLDERGMWGNTPLLVATQYAHAEVALALIDRGANTGLENERRATALHFSCAEGLVDVGRALLDNGAGADPPVAAVHHPGVNGGQTVSVTPLSAAATGGHTELVRLLLQHGAEIDRGISSKPTKGESNRHDFSGTNGCGGSALTAAAQYGHTETCLALIDSGASMLLEVRYHNHAVHANDLPLYVLFFSATPVFGRSAQCSTKCGSILCRRTYATCTTKCRFILDVDGTGTPSFDPPLFVWHNSIDLVDIINRHVLLDFLLHSRIHTERPKFNTSRIRIRELRFCMLFVVATSVQPWHCSMRRDQLVASTSWWRQPTLELAFQEFGGRVPSTWRAIRGCTRS